MTTTMATTTKTVTGTPALTARNEYVGYDDDCNEYDGGGNHYDYGDNGDDYGCGIITHTHEIPTISTINWARVHGPAQWLHPDDTRIHLVIWK